MRIYLEFEVRRVQRRSCGKVKRERLEFLSVTELVMHDFGIAHSTIQVEVAGDNVHPAKHEHAS